MKIELSREQITELLTVLGAAGGAFEDMKETQPNVGKFHDLLDHWIETTNTLGKEITRQANEQI